MDDDRGWFLSERCRRNTTVPNAAWFERRPNYETLKFPDATHRALCSCEQ